MNKIFKRSPVEKIYNERIKICKECPKMDDIGLTCVITGTQPCCSVCGCSLALKLRSLDSECPHPDGARWWSKNDKI